jgi:hypothetical protein
MVTGTDRRGLASASAELARAREAALKLLAYCRANDWAGYDPYDALNSRLYQSLPILHFRLARLVLTQGMKRCPLNLRPLLLVPRTQNPKGLALFLSAVLKLSKVGLLEEPALIGSLAERLQALRSPDSGYWCWGYSFPWQTRTVLVPRGAPNLVCTTFVANALLDLYEACHETRWLDMAVSAADYVLKELYWTDGGGVAGFSYPTPTLRLQVHNANFLGAALLCRVAMQPARERFLEPALKVARYSAGHQRADGSWHYSEASTQRWIDNFHTGFNLCALRRIGECAETTEFEPRVVQGFDFYRKYFFTPEGTPKYYHDRTYPLDVHSVAQSVLTLLEFRHFDQQNVGLAHRVLDWSLANLRHRDGYFYYQKLAWTTIKIPYLRWGQAWMLLALASFLERDSEMKSARFQSDRSRVAEETR